jgi:hypothetical protein
VILNHFSSTARWQKFRRMSPARSLQACGEPNRDSSCTASMCLNGLQLVSPVSLHGFGRAMPQKQCVAHFGNGARYPVSICSMSNPPSLISDGMSRVTWQPSNAH